ncbi:hypothetical protein CHRY9390_00404 [Chryseobacterium aquaeductus]|uniref:VOC domain-containing protein n=1 Tax=Chryseobacterium aquaeductus TaxID=2675056 RepID=A0A9N8MDE1_9FLAO|nr:VOC family protein [Chryseobacterium aquaeductus]CAA7329761.1 hypothetical protein CHRY9390_00404 [Chryseobacterium potabilaquae]CAD7798897.1 hypothetical protein CHRY9390_00404 [Chryseobacterium aquaeductus]
MNKPTSIKFIQIPVKDLKRATHFYSNGLGLNYLYDADGCAYYSLGNIEIILDPNLNTDSNFISYFLEDDEIKETFQKLIEYGATAVSLPEVYSYFKDKEQWRATLLDTEGNSFGITADIWNDYF